MSNVITPQRRMSAMNIGGVWRGPLVLQSISGFDAGNRAAAVYLYSGSFTTIVTAVAVTAEAIPYSAASDVAPYRAVTEAEPYSTGPALALYRAETEAEPYQSEASADPYAADTDVGTFQ